MIELSLSIPPHSTTGYCQSTSHVYVLLRMQDNSWCQYKLLLVLTKPVNSKVNNSPCLLMDHERMNERVNE